MKTNETDDPSRKLDRRNPASTRDSRRSGRDADREDEKRSDFRNPKDRGRDKDRSRGEDKEPAWMGDYIPDPNDAKGGILGGQRTDGTIDDLQAWKRGMKEKSDSTLFEVPDILSVDTLDDIQIFKRKLKEEQEKQDRAAKDNDTKVASANPPLPPGLPATATNDEKQGQSAALAALLSPLALQLQSTMDVSTDNASLGNASRSQKPNPDSLLSSGLGNATSLSFNRYPDIMPELTSSRDPLAVAGLPTAGRALDEFGLRNEPGTSNPTPPVSDIRISNQQTLSLNGRLTPTNSNPTSTTPSAQSSTYSGEGSPSSGSALPAYAQSKGSRFAKFWDNKPRESATSFNPSQQSQPLAPPSNPMGSSLGTWSSGASLSNDLRVSQPSSPLRQAPAESSALNNLLRNITTPSSVIPPTDRRDFTDRPASRTRPDTDKMQSLLSMLNNQQPRPPAMDRNRSVPPFAMFKMAP
ncbi:uncharacterized protein EI90DRAFT_1605262 [Cantharellus anzutake]|uniref:uncharacterized protein n=1 Tax=Cantharellus anzutake TaxID=1750568 RepID=UPI001904FFDC|nr:uncharacterized protein EI90DRAFT_1605262 [Cantharellus anzutake]KAF8328141.1 hypothetical protein EI90DRAFT_1605262 [Cantharellus anzutake]